MVAMLVRAIRAAGWYGLKLLIGAAIGWIMIGAIVGATVLSAALNMVEGLRIGRLP